MLAILVGGYLFFGISKYFRVVAFQGNSMAPSLYHGDRMVGLYPGSLQRGDLVYFQMPEKAFEALYGPAQMLGVGSAFRPYLIKRIVGLPGDVVHFEQGQVFVNDRSIPDAQVNAFWRKQGCFDRSSEGANFALTGMLSGEEPQKKITVPDGHYYVLGDTRQEKGSEDSRFFGVIAQRDIHNKVVAVVWPLFRAPEAQGLCGMPSYPGAVKFTGASSWYPHLLKRWDF
ncbi:hypothetical protein DC3_14590 [Deinococcus cellulosilyticus NBRC 106333 = KACC 11606]|uniref:Signal peptidase I n=1 Tax=Deinococcus cellulosilyticus (strain DSM 18568 / NBRC 106333 / KACC 11606 / 5516J-15) TaxID=1223518 RepID=A0A511MZ10_DEIC1|nr:hypothetical protein DC3_14590 [Deinococcus cellulosilyticus NBRC 106333 = KACC 11606]